MSVSKEESSSTVWASNESSWSTPLSSSDKSWIYSSSDWSTKATLSISAWELIAWLLDESACVAVLTIDEFFAICRSTTDFPGLEWVSSPVATTDTLAVPSNFSSKIEPTITSASGWTCSLISLVILSTSCSVRSVPPVILIRRPFAPSSE